MTVDEISRLPIFQGMPADLVVGLVDAADEVAFEVGDELWLERQPAIFWWVLLEGRLEMIRHVGRERAVMGAFTTPGQWGEGWGAFDPHAVNLITAVGTQRGRMMRVPVGALRALTDGVPLIRHFLDGFFQTARDVEYAMRQREALVALGTLSAGLAHELNNPASAALRSVEALGTSLGDLSGAVRGLAEQGIVAATLAALDDLLAEARPPGNGSDTLAVADREEALSTWLVDHGVHRDWVLAPTLAAASLDEGWCDRVLATVGTEALQPALDWVASTLASQALLGEVRGSAQLVSDLVGSVKSYSQLDRGSYQRISVGEGLDSTLAVLAHRLGPGVQVVRSYGADVPLIDAYPGELNQAWTGLIENAADAMAGRGVLTLTVSPAATTACSCPSPTRAAACPPRSWSTRSTSSSPPRRWGWAAGWG